MNYSKFSELGILEPHVVDKHFCKIRLSPEKQKKNLAKCLRFFSVVPEGEWSECPFGFSALRCGFHCLCGCFSSAHPLTPAIEARRKVLPSEKRLLSVEDSEIIVGILESEIYCESYSGFIHDFSHSIGFLKTHMDSCRNYRFSVPNLDRVYALYEELVDKFVEYNSVVIAKPNINEWIRTDFVPSKIYDGYKRKVSHYRSLIDCLPDLFSRIEESVSSIKARVQSLPTTELNKHKLFSLLYMNGLFQCRLEYANKVYAFNKTPPEDNPSSPKSPVSIFDMVQKLVYLLKTPAEQKQLNGLFLNGESYLKPSTTRDVYLGFFILLENALKYAVKNTRVIVEIEDKDNRCEVRILNVSGYISQESMKWIVKAGFTGENGKNKESHGLGLAIAKRIFSEAGTNLAFSYDSDSSTFEAKVSF